MRLKVLGKLKKKISLIGTRSRDLPACSIAPQATTLPRTPRPHVSLFGGMTGHFGSDQRLDGPAKWALVYVRDQVLVPYAYMLQRDEMLRFYLLI
jgi:hypothetical protein